MQRQWTRQQLSAINSTAGSVLVSAAAGSGKTAVLVERVIRLITREDNPVDADRLLIVTFTRAAAAEMKQRINSALNALLDENPFDSRLVRQKQLLCNAKICTIDSFCGDLVREYYHVLDVQSDFRIAENGELDVITGTAMDAAFEEFYSSDKPDFFRLLDAFSAKDGDIRLRETVLKICGFLRTQPFPQLWLSNMLSEYAQRDISDSVWGRIIKDYAYPAVSHAVNLTHSSIGLLETEEKLYEKNLPLLEQDMQFLENLQSKLLSDDWDLIIEQLCTFSAGRFNTPKGYKEHPVKLAVCSNRDEVKETVNDLKKYFCRTQEEADLELEELEQLVTTLFDVVRRFIFHLDSEKAKKNILTFSDVESLAVRLLATPDGDGYVKTEQAYEISSRFDAVIVDEYQDVNDVQNLIFNCCSTAEENLFVVGDIKQSIYGFRQAKPQIFLKRKKEYNRFDEDKQNYPGTIILDKNFRSRREVCETVNFIFSRIMSEQSAQMDYTSDEFLNVGADYPEEEGCETELVMIEKNAFEDLSKARLEAAYIARKIREMMSGGFCVTDSGVKRPVTYSDFAVIMRSPRNLAAEYVGCLAQFGIPAYCEEKENAFDSQEIKLLLNFLRIIDNPSLDIPMLSVLCSPIYGFTPDELAQMRASHRFASLYFCASKYAEQNGKAQRFCSELSALRAFSFTCGTEELIGKILEITAFGAITCAVKGGELPLANINLLRSYAVTYEQNGYKSLSEFIGYIDRMIENGTQLPAASNDGSATLNGVRVLSIHKSKGLEFPVCFIADACHRFNRTDLKSDVLIDSEAGLGIKRKSGVCRYNTLPRFAVELEISKNELSEELRVLYVALTRAREKLIILGTASNCEAYLSSIASKPAFGLEIEPYSVIRARCIFDWIAMCAAVNPTVRNQMFPSAEKVALRGGFPEWSFEMIDDEELLYGVLPSSEYASGIAEQTDKAAFSGTDYGDLLRKNTSFVYKNSAVIGLPQKISASEITHSEGYFDRVIAKPAFLSGESADAVERGTAHHLVLQYCDFASARRDIGAEIERLVSNGRLTRAQADCVDKDRLSRLLRGELFNRVIRSPKVYREERFTVRVKPSVIFEDMNGSDSKASVIVQGAVDLAFEENGSLVIIDYKTDRVKDISKLKILYKKQLDIYREAMSQAFDAVVSQCVICSVHLNDYIEV